MERQRRALEEIAAWRRGRDEGGVIVLKDSDEEAPPPTNPVRQGDPGQGCNKDGGGDYTAFYKLLGMQQHLLDVDADGPKIRPAPGAVTLDGADICGLDVLALRRRVGMLFQLPAMFHARTLANEPEVLLLDEPTSALDPISTQNIEEAIVRLKKTRGITAVIVSHSVRQIQRIADLVCLVVDGVVVEVLAPSDLSQAKHPMARRFLELS
uniref:ABC transporter domain-containing protein n=1 Tax=Aegilops tauschii TaxID=37682 RepID=R7WA37_AEGTA